MVKVDDGCDGDARAWLMMTHGWEAGSHSRERVDGRIPPLLALESHLQPFRLEMRVSRAVTFCRSGFRQTPFVVFQYKCYLNTDIGLYCGEATLVRHVLVACKKAETFTASGRIRRTVCLKGLCQKVGLEYLAVPPAIFCCM
jgi:hypothetical protein